MIYLVLAFIGIIGIFYYNTFVWLVGSWQNNIYYSHGFLVPLISGYIIWSMRKELTAIEKKQSQAGLALFTGGILLQGIGIMWTIRFLSGLSLVVTISGIILFMYGWEFIKKIMFPILFLFLMIPVPFVDVIAPPLQTVSAIGTENLAYFVGIPVQRDGLILQTPAGAFEVALPCSGLRSVISLLTIGVIFAFILEGGMLMKLIVIASSVPLALAGNILRITSVLEVANKYGTEVAMNYFEGFSNLILFSIALLGLFMVGRCFGRLRLKKIF
ncbi:Transmembrane exosortase (Exosortase_EpsH) [uncultured archaeon]|nr:Transmembrane exosortase (Exosortase_EpsH) [uncultured archaeon]